MVNAVSGADHDAASVAALPHRDPARPVSTPEHSATGRSRSPSPPLKYSIDLWSPNSRI